VVAKRGGAAVKRLTIAIAMDEGSGGSKGGNHVARYRIGQLVDVTFAPSNPAVQSRIGLVKALLAPRIEAEDRHLRGRDFGGP
jgi:hypothetical protein